jgi:hypothetical protein
VYGAEHGAIMWRARSDVVSNAVHPLMREECQARPQIRLTRPILKHGLDRLAPTEASSPQLSLVHENVRGRDYYN